MEMMPDPRPQVGLQVVTQDSQSEIFVVDREFRLVTRSRGQVSRFSLEPGIYQVKVRTGAETLSEHVVLTGDEPEVVKEFGPIRFASPAPLEQTRKTHEYHLQAAQENSTKVHAESGSGSFIYVVIRDWNPDARAFSSFAEHPARGLFLTRPDYTPVVDFERESAAELEPGEPWSACNVSVDPGHYLLRQQVSSGETIEQSVFASPDWQTQVFMLLRTIRTPSSTAEGELQVEKLPDLARSSVLMAPAEVGFLPDEAGAREVELARLSLAHGRPALPESMIDRLLMGKYENPMLGIYGANLLLRSNRKEALEYMPQIVRNLRKLLGIPHPDVEALALVTNINSVRRFHAPPMLLDSWSNIVKASMHREDLVPADSIAARASLRLIRAGPWFVWRGALPESIELEGEGSAMVDLLRRMVAVGEKTNPPTRVRKPRRARRAAAIPVGPEPGLPERAGFDSQVVDRLVEQTSVPKATMLELLQRFDLTS